MPYVDMPGPSTAMDVIDENFDTIDDRLHNNRQKKELDRHSRRQNVRSPTFVGYSDRNRETEKDSLNGDEQGILSDNPTGKSATPSPKLTSSRKFFSLLTQNRSHVFLNSYPYHYLWIYLSSMYGVLLLILMFVISLTEIMDNEVELFSLQGAYLMYLYVGSIAVIICIYIWVLADSCSSINNGDSNSAEAAELTRFGSLKKAHISRTKTSNTSFYLRIGALAFGLGTLVFSGLEMAMHSMMEVSCLNHMSFIHPILHALFTFLQMHFLFVNSQVLVEKFGLIARFGFMHLAATNVALWIKLIIWETGMEWIYFVFLAQSRTEASLARSAPIRYDSEIPTPLQLRGFPSFLANVHERAPISGLNFSFDTDEQFWQTYKPISDRHVKQIVTLHYCVNSNSLGQLWTSSMPFLYPFIVQFSLIAAGVTYVMGQQVGAERLRKQQQSHTKSHQSVNNNNHLNNNNNNNHNVTKFNNYKSSDYMVERADCSGVSKGLFVGLLCLVVLIVVIVIFLVVKEDNDFPPHVLNMLTYVAAIAVLLVCITLNAVGLVRIRKMSFTNRRLSQLDGLLNSVSIIGVLVYAVFSMLVGSTGIFITEIHSMEQHMHMFVFILGGMQLLQCCLQSTFIGEAYQRTCATRHQLITKPARQIITFLLCVNIGIWAYECFVTQSWISQELQLKFYGLLVWGIISRICTPLLIFYRFHSTILLLDIWNRCYSNKYSQY